MIMEPRLNDNAMAEIEKDFLNDKEAHELLSLINAEFQSDPMSIQCFDLRIVDRIRKCVAQYERSRVNRWFP